MITTCFIIVGILVVGYRIYIAAQEDGKQCELVKSDVEHQEEVSVEDLAKQVKYNDLQLQYEMLPSAPIADIETFKNFCLIVHEEVCYNDYEIQNYLLLKKHK